MRRYKKQLELAQRYESESLGLLRESQKLYNDSQVLLQSAVDALNESGKLLGKSEERASVSKAYAKAANQSAYGKPKRRKPRAKK